MANIPRAKRLARKREELKRLDAGTTRAELVREIEKLAKEEAAVAAREDRARRYGGLTTAEIKLVQRALAEPTDNARDWFRRLLVDVGKVSAARALELIPRVASPEPQLVGPAAS